MKYNLIIFDLDGTLYHFKESKNRFTQAIKNNGIRFIARKLGVSQEEACKIRQDISDKYFGQLSIGLERELALPREEYFTSAFNMDPAEVIDFESRLKNMVDNITIKKCVLSTAPVVWINRVLPYIGLENSFQGVWSGDGDIRKPQEEAYLQVMNYFKISASNILIVEDEFKNLVPAKRLGMNTVLVGSEKADFIDYYLKDILDLEAILK